jgi:hypothetical protein
MASKEESLFFRNVEQWLKDNPGKSLAEWRKEVGYTGPALKKRGRAGEIRVSYKGKSADVAVIRTANEIMQRAGADAYGKGIVAPKGSGLEEHHKRVISVYQPFFEGLNNKEKRELAQWFVDEGAPLGNAEQNLTALTKTEHKAIHDWMKENYIQATGKPLLSFKDVPLNERLPAAVMFLENVQPAIDEQLSLIQKGGTVKFKPSGLGAALGALPVAGAIFDVGDVKAGAEGYMQEDQTPMQQFGSGLQAISGATGLAAMVPTPASPALGAVSAVTGGAAAAVQSGAVSKAIKQAPSAVKKIQQIERILNPVGASITNELKFIGGQVRLGKIPYFN